MTSAAAAPVTTLVSSIFDATAEGWTAVGDVAAFGHQVAGGNPGGHIEVTDLAQGPYIYFVAPSAYLGDLSAAFGGDLSFDLLISGGGSYATNEDVLLTGGGTTIVRDIANPAKDVWTGYSMALDDTGGWKVGSSAGAAATNTQIKAVPSNVTDLRIRAEYISGADTGGLDNVEVTGTVPVPAGAVLMLSGLALVAGARRLRK